jgi:hypothetical protein
MQGCALRGYRADKPPLPQPLDSLWRMRGVPMPGCRSDKGGGCFF